MAQFAFITRVSKFATIYRNRADYLTKTGKEAPAFDWSRPRKMWVDDRPPSDPDTEIEYSGLRLDANGKPYYDQVTEVCEIRAFKLYPEVATSVNLPPEPFPADAEMTPIQRAMAKRAIPEPLSLLEGERVMMSLTGWVVDDGKPLPGTVGGGGYTEADRSIAKDTRSLALTISSRLARIEELLASFQNPAPK